MSFAKPRLDPPAPRDLLLAATALVLFSSHAFAQEKPAANVAMVLNGHTAPVEALNVRPDGKMLITASQDGTVKLWTLPDGQLVGTQEGHSAKLRSMALGRNGTMLASGGGSAKIKLWEVGAEEEEKQELILKGSEKEKINVLASTPDGEFFISGGSDGTLALWKWKDGSSLEKLPSVHTRGIVSLAVSPDSKLVASGGEDKKIRLWSLPDGKPVLDTLEGHGGSVLALAITPDRKVLISGSGDKTIRFWSLSTGAPLKTLRGQHNGQITALVLAREGSLLISASMDKVIKLWSVATGEFLGDLEGHTDSISALAVTPDGKTLVSADMSGVVRLWDLSAKKVQSFLFDPEVSENDAEVFEVPNSVAGQPPLIYTLPAGYIRGISPRIISPRIILQGNTSAQPKRVAGCSKRNNSAGSPGQPSTQNQRQSLRLKLPLVTPNRVLPPRLLRPIYKPVKPIPKPGLVQGNAKPPQNKPPATKPPLKPPAPKPPPPKPKGKR